MEKANREKNTIIHNEKAYFIQPIYDNYAASADGYIIHLKRLQPTKERLRNNGYLDIDVAINHSKQNASHIG